MTPNDARRVRGRSRDEAAFPVASPSAAMPRGYSEMLAALKERIGQERQRVVFAANTAMIVLYWDIGRAILHRQDARGWGAKVIDRLSHDLREAYPDMKGFSPRNLKYMRAFAAAWPDAAIVQRVVARLPWRQGYGWTLDKALLASRRVWLSRLGAAALVPELQAFWKRNILRLVPDPASDAGSDYERCVDWLRALREIDPDAAGKLLGEWGAVHWRRKSLWRVVRKKDLPVPDLRGRRK